MFNGIFIFSSFQHTFFKSIPLSNENFGRLTKMSFICDGRYTLMCPLKTLSKISGDNLSRSTSIFIEEASGKKMNIDNDSFVSLYGISKTRVFKFSMKPDVQVNLK